MNYEILFDDPAYPTLKCKARNKEEAIQKANQHVKALQLDTYIVQIMIYIKKSFCLGDYDFELKFLDEDVLCHRKTFVGTLYWYCTKDKIYKAATITYEKGTKNLTRNPSCFELDYYGCELPRKMEIILEKIMDNYRARIFPDSDFDEHRDLNKELKDIVKRFGGYLYD